MIGQCGLTMQPWKEDEVLEIGCLLGNYIGIRAMQLRQQKLVKNMPLRY